jgi:protoheme ferro-lyase
MFNDSEQVLRRMKADGVNALVVLPLYPQFSVSTSGSSLKVSSRCERTLQRKWMGNHVLGVPLASAYVVYCIKADSLPTLVVSCSC